MSYNLKEKITATKELLSELEIKSWQEIEHLQFQIDNLAEGQTNNKLKRLLKNLLTSYYVFAGGIETLVSDSSIEVINICENEPTPKIEPEVIEAEPEIFEPTDYVSHGDSQNLELSEPFEYFMDFDDPVGAPITDKDLYNS